MNKTNTKTGVRNDDGGILEAILGETKPTPEASLQLADPSLLSYYTQRANRTVWITGEVGEDIMVYEQMILAWNDNDRLPKKGADIDKIQDRVDKIGGINLLWF